MPSKNALRLSLLLLITAIASCNRQPPSSSTSSVTSTDQATVLSTSVLSTSVPSTSVPSTSASVNLEPNQLGLEASTNDNRTELHSKQLDLSLAEIGQIPINATEAEVIRFWGDPTQTNDQETECCGVLRSLIYPTLTIELIEGETGFQVYGVSTRSETVATGNGIKVGDRRQSVIDIYGEPTRISTEAATTSLVYELGDATTFMTFAIEGDQIVEISYNSLLN